MLVCGRWDCAASRGIFYLDYLRAFVMSCTSAFVCGEVVRLGGKKVPSLKWKRDGESLASVHKHVVCEGLSRRGHGGCA